MKNRGCLASIFILVININGFGQNEKMFLKKLTAINPVSYTDVVFTGVKDTVLVGTYSGRIAEYVNGINKEKIICEINDEIYVINYNPRFSHVAVSTLGSGIIIINKKTGKEIKRLELKDTWALRMNYSKDYRYLFANDQRGNFFLWSANENYKKVELPAGFPKGIVAAVDNNIFTLVTSTKIITWDFELRKITSEAPVKLARLGDMDEKGNVLSIEHNECKLYNTKIDSVVFAVKHPNWLRPVESLGGEDAAKSQGLKVENGYFEDPNSHMAITAAKFGKDKIFTSSIDRSVRVWNKITGKLVKSLTGHKATVNKLKVNASQSQLVSIDLKGGIKFWDIESDL